MTTLFNVKDTSSLHSQPICTEYCLITSKNIFPYIYIFLLFHLVAALKFNTNLKELYLGRNNLNTDDSLHIAAIIKNNPHLQVLDLRDNSIQVCLKF